MTAMQYLRNTSKGAIAKSLIIQEKWAIFLACICNLNELKRKMTMVKNKFCSRNLDMEKVFVIVSIS